MKRFYSIACLLVVGLCMRAEAAAVDYFDYGMVGIAAGQTLRLNVSNSDLPTAAAGKPSGPLQVELNFFDPNGGALVPAVQKILPAGVSTHLDINGDLFARGGARVEVRPVFRRIEQRSADRSVTKVLPPGPCITSIEIIDNLTGKTVVASGPQNPGVIRGFNPQPDPPGLPCLLNFTRGQTVRLNVVNIPDRASTGFPPDPCRAHLFLLDESGRMVATSTIDLKTGQAGFLDLAFPTTEVVASGDGSVRPIGSRQSVRPFVFTGGIGGFPPGPCRVSVEVFDNFDGKTQLMLAL